MVSCNPIPNTVAIRIGWTILFTLIFLIVGLLIHPLYYAIVSSLGLNFYFDMFVDFQVITMLIMYQWIAFCPILFEKIALLNKPKNTRLTISIFVNVALMVINVPFALLLFYAVKILYEEVYIPNDDDETLIAVSYFVGVTFFVHVTMPYILPQLFLNKRGRMNPMLCHAVSFSLWIFTLPAYLAARKSKMLLFTIVNSFLMFSIFLHDNFILQVSCKAYREGTPMERTQINLAVLSIGSIIYCIFSIYLATAVIKVFNPSYTYKQAVSVGKQYGCFFQESQWAATLITYYVFGNPMSKQFLKDNEELKKQGEKERRFSNIMWAPAFMTFLISIVVCIFGAYILQPMYYSNISSKLYDNQPTGIFIYSYALIVGTPMLCFLGNHITYSDCEERCAKKEENSEEAPMCLNIETDNLSQEDTEE